MSAEQPSNTEGKADVQMDTGSSAKGKGKAAEPNDAMSEDDSENSEEEAEGEPEEADEDNMEEIDPDNIVQSRTRGKNIDYAEAAKQMPEGDDDEEDDEDFQDDDAMED
ncbi:uncharacterized protein SEPMUDRAFT_161329 [Sphaerulina musiva SO2202]|uniref:Histone chaperone domain-containing protein n=1 Tax=Sphaerulina musiva (strain SO2202) TaxID=692275 RepID=M3DAE7_SPHMS|nr:uncharacterized protein SEPMUDRAFT_161329 [Sphaerulina musiva SO2202]EMF15070.1 hypothetical protein SEPMUDRAFT_161329 [Sphaerulina musiva SO2202]